MLSVKRVGDTVKALIFQELDNLKQKVKYLGEYHHYDTPYHDGYGDAVREILGMIDRKVEEVCDEG